MRAHKLLLIGTRHTHTSHKQGLTLTLMRLHTTMPVSHAHALAYRASAQQSPDLQDTKHFSTNSRT